MWACRTVVVDFPTGKIEVQSGFQTVLSGLHRRFTRTLQLRVKSVALRLGAGWLHEIEVEKLLQEVERPFGFLRLHLHNLTRIRGFNWVRGKIPDIANCIEVFGEVRGQLVGIENLLDLLRQILMLDTELFPQQVL